MQQYKTEADIIKNIFKKIQRKLVETDQKQKYKQLKFHRKKVKKNNIPFTIKVLKNRIFFI